MSLLEDVFLEDEAGEAQALERVIEADEYDVYPRATSPNSDENSAREDEAEEDKRRVDPTQSKAKRIVKNPRFILNPARLTGPRGIQVIPEHFKDFKFKGKGHEKEDLDLVLKKLEHWAYRLYPKFSFEDCLKKIETLGKKRPVMVHLQKIRNDQLVTSDEHVVDKYSSDDENTSLEQDEFDKLLQQQIELARVTPAQSSVKKVHSPPRQVKTLIMPKATSSPSISEEQRERIMRNRKLAEERRLAKLAKEKQNYDSESNTDITSKNLNINTNLNEESEQTSNVEVITVEIHDTNTENHEKKLVNHVTQDCNIRERSRTDLSETVKDNEAEFDNLVHEDLNIDINKVNDQNNSNRVELSKSQHDDDIIGNIESGEAITDVNDQNDSNNIDLPTNQHEVETNGIQETADERRNNVNLLEKSTKEQSHELDDMEIMDVDFSEEF